MGLVGREEEGGGEMGVGGGAEGFEPRRVRASSSSSSDEPSKAGVSSSLSEASSQESARGAGAGFRGVEEEGVVLREREERVLFRSGGDRKSVV